MPHLHHHVMCALCPFDKNKHGVVEPAVYIVNGYSVCDKHIGYVAQGMNWHATLEAMNPL